VVVVGFAGNGPARRAGLREGDAVLGRRRLAEALDLFTRAGLEPWQRRMRARLTELGRSAPV